MRGPAPTTIVPVPTSSPRPDKRPLTVPLSMCPQSQVTLEVPELTPPGCRPTLVCTDTLEAAQELKEKAIKTARQAGQPIYNGKDGKAEEQLPQSKSR